MKITTEHVEQLKTMIDQVIVSYRETHQSDDLTSLHTFYIEKCAGTDKDWKKLFVWAMLYAVPYQTRVVWFDQVYQYANDDHIYTALKYVAKNYLPST